MPLNNSGKVALVLLIAGSGGVSYGQRVMPPPQYDPPRANVPVSTLDQPAPADLPQGPGPRGTSGQEQRYDMVGYAGAFDGGAPQYSTATVSVGHSGLPVGSYVELTALDTGRTIVALVAGPGGSGRSIVDLSPAAAQQLGIEVGARVRVRLVAPSPQDQMALRSGRTAAARMDAPQSLLVALRHKLPGRSSPASVRPSVRTAAPPPGARYAPPGSAPRPAPPLRPAPPQAAPARSGYLVQVAAFSTRERAQTAAGQVGGRITPAGNLFRVQVGPFADAASAKRARDEAARHGYADARILHIE